MKPPLLFVIPYNATPSVCTCGRKIWKVPNPKTGSTVPVTAQSVFQYNGETVSMPEAVPPEPDRRVAGYGWNHFVDCPDRESFRRDRPKRRPAPPPRDSNDGDYIAERISERDDLPPNPFD